MPIATPCGSPTASEVLLQSLNAGITAEIAAFPADLDRGPGSDQAPTPELVDA